uniref:Uncharacterized protein n=1 Tax=Pseudomonas phage Cygsa01 TaxID=3138529 RepID=A0AAU6W3A4_9VIRU
MNTSFREFLKRWHGPYCELTSRPAYPHQEYDQ